MTLQNFKEKQHSERENIMTAGEVASFLKVSITAVRRWTRDGKLKGHKLGGSGDWRYFESDVMNFLTAGDRN